MREELCDVFLVKPIPRQNFEEDMNMVENS